MEKLKITYKDWNYAYYHLQSEEDTHWLYENEYKQRISRRIPKEKQNYTLEQWANFAYNQNLKMVKMTWEGSIKSGEYNDILGKIGFPFMVTALLEFNEQPYAYIIFLGSGLTVSFIDELGRTYLSYHFEAIHNQDKTREGCVFLNTLSIRYYHKEKDEYGDWDYDYTDYEFTPKGELRKIEEIDGVYSEYKSEQRVNVESNWQKYPDFGDWLPLFNMKSWKDEELLDLSSVKPDPYKIHEGKEYTKEEWQQYQEEKRKNARPGTTWSLLIVR